MLDESVVNEMKGRLVPDESIPERLEEKDIKPVRPFEIEESVFGQECSVFLPVGSIDGQGFETGVPKFSKMIFASREDAEKEIKKYLNS